MGLPLDESRVGPEAVIGIEINGYAAELARLTVWITELQWQLRKGLGLTRRPILDKLGGIVRADALITQSGRDTAWPEADVVVGNPPFLGGKLMRTSLRDDYVDRLFAAFAGRVPAEADLVTYWFAKAWEYMREGRLKRAGLVGTNSIRGGANRRILDRIAREGVIFDAWDDEPWVLDGAAVRVSLVCFSQQALGEAIRLDGRIVERSIPT
jgi:type II restriction/modification system DNA methylase subunit YeeA